MELLKERFDDIQNLIINISKKIDYLEKIPRNFGTGDMLYCTEIHTIDIIGRNSGINITRLSKKMGVTKGAISQCIAKLEKKELLVRVSHLTNDKEVLLQLTDKGKLAFDGHEQYHKQMANDLKDDFKNMNADKFIFLFKMLKRVERYVNRLVVEQKK